jgi:hypothetical protein
MHNPSCQPDAGRTPRPFLVAIGPARLHSALGVFVTTRNSFNDELPAFTKTP